jgi:hypothetical protein
LDAPPDLESGLLEIEPPAEAKQVEKSPLEDPLVQEIKTFKNDDDMALIRVIDDFHDSRERRDELETDWEEFYRLWRGKMKVRPNYPLIAKAFIPMTYSFVETMVPFLLDAVYDDRRFIVGVGQEPSDVEQAKVIGQYENYEFVHRIKYGAKLTETIRSLLIYGTAWQKVYYRVSSVPDLRKLDEDAEARLADATIKEGKLRRRMNYNEADVEPLSVWNVYPDFAFTDPADMRFVVHRYYTSLSKLKQMERDGEGNIVLKNLDKIMDTQLPHGDFAHEGDDMYQARLASQGKGSGRSEDTTGIPDDNHRHSDPIVECLDWWSGPWLIRIVNRNIVIFNDANPLPVQRPPFVKFTAIDDGDFLYGIGIPETVRSLQNVSNVLLNQRLDNVNLILNPMWKVRRAGAVNVKQLVSRPGGFIHVNQADDVMPHITQDVTGSAIANVNDLMGHAQAATGVTDFFRGEEPQSSRFPASGIALLQRASGRRFTTLVKSVYASVQEVIQLVHEINTEFTTEERVARVTGADGSLDYLTVDKTMLNETFVDFFPLGKAVNGNPEVLAQILSELDQRWADRPELGTDGRRSLMMAILELAQVPAVADILPKNAMQQMMAAQGGMPGAPPGGGVNPAIAEMMGLQQGGPGAPPGAAPQGGITEVLNVPPSVTNPGGMRNVRSIPIPGA